MLKLLAATGQDPIDSTLKKFNGYEVVSVVNSRDDLLPKIEKFNPEIVVIGEGLYGKESLFKYMMKITKDFPNTRIVYLAGHVDLRNEHQANNLVLLVMAGIYDIFHEKKMTAQMLKNLLDKPKTEADMEYLTKISDVGTKRKSKDAVMDFHVPEEYTDEDSESLKNVFTLFSIKPGTGKSFLSVNLATAIANFGVNKETGEKPRVALIEADLQNLSVGTLLGIDGGKKNLKAVMDKIGNIISDQGKSIATREQAEEVDKFILDAMIPYGKVKNLHALVGSEIPFSEIGGIKDVYYGYLMDLIAEKYDIVIVDANSSMLHVTTYPLMKLSNTCFYVLNLDFNNVRNNIRYKDELDSYGITHKVRYILNQDIPEEEAKGENLMFTSKFLEDNGGFDLAAKIPNLPSSIFFNRVYEGVPLILDDKPVTLRARQEILRLANDIYPIKDIEKILKMKAK